MVYDDGLIACAEDTLTIRKYGLFLRPKRIPYTQVRSLNHTANNRRELDQRSNNGIHVHLLWCPADDSLAVTASKTQATRSNSSLTPTRPLRSSTTLTRTPLSVDAYSAQTSPLATAARPPPPLQLGPGR